MYVEMPDYLSLSPDDGPLVFSGIEYQNFSKIFASGLGGRKIDGSLVLFSLRLSDVLAMRTANMTDLFGASWVDWKQPGKLAARMPDGSLITWDSTTGHAKTIDANVTKVFSNDCGFAGLADGFKDFTHQTF
jgi:hypothetical protein